MSQSDYTKLPADEQAAILKRIGITRGVVVLKAKPGYAGKPYMVRVRDEANRKYDNTSCENLAEVERVAKDRWSAFQQGTDFAGVVSTRVVLDRLLARMTKNQRTEQTKRDLRVVIEAGIEQGITNLKDPLVACKVERFLADYHPKCGFGPRRQRSPRTEAKLIGYWRQLAGEAMIAKPKPMLTMNPFMAIEMPKQADVAMETLTIAECVKLVSDEALKRREGLHWAFRLYTSTRRREATWVRWSHIDFESKRIRIALPDETDELERARMGLKQGKAVKRNKARSVRLPDELAALLLPLKPDVGECYVFPESMRSRANNNEIKAFHNHLKACGINRPEIHPHELRSTSACIWSALIPEDRLIRHLGHSDKAMTRHYSEKADEYEHALKDWNGQWRLRPKGDGGCNAGATGPILPDLPVASGTMSENDDIGNDWFVVLPDLTGLATG